MVHVGQPRQPRKGLLIASRKCTHDHTTTRTTSEGVAGAGVAGGGLAGRWRGDGGEIGCESWTQVRGEWREGRRAEERIERIEQIRIDRP